MPPFEVLVADGGSGAKLLDEVKRTIKSLGLPGRLEVLPGSVARGFQEAVGIDGVVLTKIDADAKGGAALSITHTVGKPILFLSTGQGYEEMVAFNPTWMAERLLERE